MDLNQFFHERQAKWHRLSTLLDRVDESTLAGLTPAEADELFVLYRLASSDLNLIQTRAGNPALLSFLEQLVGRAYANLSAPRRFSFFSSWWRIVRHGFPATLRAESRMLALAATAMAAGVALGFMTTLLMPDAAEVFLPPEHLEESPRRRVAELETMEREGKTRIESTGQHSLFTTFLFTHNIRVTVLCFALGFTFGVGTVALLLFNGAMLGSIAARYLTDGVFTFFVAWVGPHGSIELPCVIVGGTAGLMVARAQLRRDRGSTLAQIRADRPALMQLLAGTATLLVIAGIVEGGFSQINEPVLPYELKIFVAGALFIALLAYWFVMPVRPLKPDADSALVVPDESAAADP